VKGRGPALERLDRQRQFHGQQTLPPRCVNIAEVTTAVATGDLSKKITVDVKGEILELKNTINTMVDQLRSFAAEVTRVAREVGTEGSSAARPMSKAWPAPERPDRQRQSDGRQFDAQVRNIAEVTPPSQRRPVQADHRGREGRDFGTEKHHQYEVDQLSSFAAEVTRVAREVGTEGKLRAVRRMSRASPAPEGLDRQREFHGRHLTSQVRGIAEVTTPSQRRLSKQNHRGM